MSFRNPQSRARPQQRRGGSLTFFSDYLTSCEGPPPLHHFFIVTRTSTSPPFSSIGVVSVSKRTCAGFFSCNLVILLSPPFPPPAPPLLDAPPPPSRSSSSQRVIGPLHPRCFRRISAMGVDTSYSNCTGVWIEYDQKGWIACAPPFLLLLKIWLDFEQLMSQEQRGKGRKLLFLVSRCHVVIIMVIFF